MVELDNALTEAKELLRNEEFEKAITLLEALYSDNPSEKVKKSLIGALFLYGGYLNDDYVLEYEKSMDFFRRIIALEPSNYKAYYNLGISYYNLEQFEEALSEYMKAIKINPNYKHCYYNIGLLYESIGKHQNAVNAYRKALEIDPNYIYAMHALNSLKQNADNKLLNEDLPPQKKVVVTQLVALLKVSKRIRIDIIQEVLKISKETLIELLIKWGDKFACEIDGDYFNINKENIDKFLEYLDVNGIEI